jgi:hypothetical protein
MVSVIAPHHGFDKHVYLELLNVFGDGNLKGHHLSLPAK